jgi:DNA primase
VNVAASLGTSFTDSHASLLKRFTKNIYLCFDGDTAGMKAALKSFEVLAAGGLFVFGIPLPKGMDPDDYISTYGKESFMMLKENAEEIPFFLTNLILSDAGFKKASLPEKLEKLAPVLAAIGAVSDRIRQSYYVKDLALKLGISEKDIASQIKSGIKTFGFRDRKEVAKPLAHLHSVEKALLVLLMNKPELKAQLTDIESDIKGLPVEPYYRQLMEQDFSKISEVMELFTDDLKEFLMSSMDEVTVKVDVIVSNLKKYSVSEKIKKINEKLRDYADTLTEDEFTALIIEKTKLQKYLHEIK